MTKESIVLAIVEVPYRDLSILIRDKLMYDIIEKYGHFKRYNKRYPTPSEEKVFYSSVLEALNDLYGILIDPIAESLEGKSKLTIVTSKYLSYVPFSALAKSEDPTYPQFLIQDYSISYKRLAFFKTDTVGQGHTKSNGVGSVIGVGNPFHKFLAMPKLDGADKEISNMKALAKRHRMPIANILWHEKATETAWKKEVKRETYSIMYFATHGVPFAEMFYKTKEAQGLLMETKDKLKTNPNDSKLKKLEARLTNFIEFSDRTFTTKSPLYGFLYMSYNGSEKDDGVLTLKEILEMPDSCFKSANLAILSACNTAVTYSPQITKGQRDDLESKKISQELVNAGFTPGVDQVSLTDTFMKRNFKSVLGTLWFADDEATGYIVGKFFENIGAMKPAEALRQAKLDYLESPPMDSDYTTVPKHPYFWAVTAVFGE